MDILTFSGGLQTTTSSFLRRKDQLIHCINAHGDEIGSLQKRLGYSKYGDTLENAQSVNGLYSYPDISGATENLFGYVNGKIKYNNAGTWTNIQTGLLANAKPEFRVFLDQLFMVGSNGSTYLTTALVDGTTYSTGGNVSGAPTGNYIEIFKDQVYIIKGSRFYFSSLPDSVGTSITWDAANDYEEVYTANGESLSGVHNNKALNRLLLFKQSTLHYWDGYRIVDAGAVGTTAHRSIATVGSVTFFYNKNRQKIYAYNGANTQQISRPIKKWVKGIQNPNDVFGIDDEDDFYRLYVGTVIVDGVSYSNCEFRYSVPDNTWTVYRWYNSFSVYAKHKVSGVERMYSGITTGDCEQLAIDGDAVYGDNGNDISSEFIYETDLGSPAERKKIDKIIFYSTRSQNLTGRIRVRGKDWSTHFSIDKDEQERNVNPQDGRFMQFHFSESSQSVPWKFEGMTFATSLTTYKYS
jgi:hypothetical protein